MFRVQAALRTQSRSRLVGPNCPGIIAPPAKCRIGIMPHLQYTPGCVGIVSKSGTLSYEAVGATTREGLGQSLCIGVGGDMLPGTSLREGLEALLRDEGTKGIVLLGEIGGEAEMEAAGFLSMWNEELGRSGGRRKPVVGMITGRTAPRGRVMGHAGAGEIFLFWVFLLRFPFPLLNISYLPWPDYPPQHHLPLPLASKTTSLLPQKDRKKQQENPKTNIPLSPHSRRLLRHRRRQDPRARSGRRPHRCASRGNRPSDAGAVGGGGACRG